MFLTLSDSSCHTLDSADHTMSFSNLFRKASNFLGLSSPDQLKPPPLDGEIIYCKNNVCVHPPAPLTLDVEHHPGYLTLKSQNDEFSGPTLILTWIPNASLKRNPSSIENSPNRSRRNSPRASPRKHARQEFAKADQIPMSSPSTSMSPRGSTVSSCSEVMVGGVSTGSQALPPVNHEDTCSTTSSETSVSTSLRDERHSCESCEQGDDKSSKLSSSCRSQCDSGIGADDIAQLIIQNNEKGGGTVGKVQGVGVNVNNLNSNKEVNLKHDPSRSTDQVVKDKDVDNSPSSESDGLTAEEQLAALLQRNKLEDKVKERKSSNRSVSIEMEGDKLVVVTQEIEGQEGMTKNEADTDVNINPDSMRDDTASLQSTDLDCPSVSSDSTDPSPSGEHYNTILGELKAGTNTVCESEPNPCSADPNVTKPDQGDATPATGSSSQSSSSKATPKATPNLSLDLKNTTAPSTSSGCTPTPDISVTRYRMSSSSSTTTSGPDSNPPSPFSSPDHSATTSPLFLCPDTPSECSSLSGEVSHNLTFPDNSISFAKDRRERKTARDQVCGVFSVNLSLMRSLRLFYSDPDCTRGQVVIASRESQYKILHFHHGGLDRLAEIFQDWSLFAQDQDKKRKDGESPYRQFLIVRPQITDDQCHPEEGLFETVTEDMWRQHMNETGQVEDVFQLRKAIFFGGLDASIRQEAWPFLLQYYPFSSTYEEREVIRNDKYIQYQDIRKKRESMSEEEVKVFWRTIQCTVEKDVVRTDRSHPYFRGDDNPNIEVLKNILLNYAVAHPHMGYTQGMSDLLAPVLAEIQHEAAAYWCFEGLMQRTIFFSSPRDTDMDKQLNHLRELLKLMLPRFYEHLQGLGQDAMELLFCHRWILLCFKREFPEADALRMWESCWAHYQTDYFHLFLCVAIIAIYGDDIIEQGLPADEVLLHFSSLAMHMNGDVVLRKARGLLHQFRSLPRIPCTLHGLCILCSPGMWDSGHVPAVFCTGNHPEGECPYQSQPNSPEKEPE